MTLYLKYRPKNLDELDLADVSESLKKIVKSGKIPHAFLFAGPKGTGKTSAARILAKIINCEKPGKDGGPCDKCEQCTTIAKGTNLDCLEMDAASHRGIDDVRALRDAVKLAPVKAKKKIYIIDEAHMLTVEASNALLKTLEEPPEHVIFILATTNPEKLIETIKSRVTYVPFRKATAKEIIRSLERVIEGEKIKIETEAIEVIAKAADGAFRDAIKILEQVTSEGLKMTKDVLESRLFSKGKVDLDNFVDLLVKKDSAGLLTDVEKMVKDGVSIEFFQGLLLSKLHSALLAKVGIPGEDVKGLDKDSLIELIELFSVEVDSPIEELPLEIAVMKWCEDMKNEPQFARLKQNSSAAKSGTDRDGSRSVTPAGRDLTQTIASVVREQTAIPRKKGGSLEVNDDAWKMILSTVKPINASIEALLRAARPVSYDGNTLVLGVFYKFHKERLEDIQHRRVLESIVAEVLGSPTKVVCTLVEPPARRIVEEAKREPVLTEGEDKDIIKVAEEIFGS